MCGHFFNVSIDENWHVGRKIDKKIWFQDQKNKVRNLMALIFHHYIVIFVNVLKCDRREF